MIARQQQFDPRVAAVDVGATRYDESSPRRVEEALTRMGEMLGWSDGERGPLGQGIERGAKVVVKPNFVMHENSGPGGMPPLLTHQSLVQAVTQAALLADPAEVMVGDAPIKGCDFDLLLKNVELDVWSQQLQQQDARFAGIHEFRRTVATFVDGVRVADENVQSEDRFVLFDRSEEHTSELQSRFGISYAVFCL